MFHHGEGFFAGVFAGVVLHGWAYPGVGVPVGVVGVEGPTRGLGGGVKAVVHLLLQVGVWAG